MKITYYSECGKNLIGERILQLRLKNGLSQKSMAAKLQVNGYNFSELTILRIEKGKRLVTDFELLALCKFFRVSPNELLCYETENK